MDKRFPFDFVYALTTLLLAFTLVHGIYSLVIRPNAAAALAHQREVWAEDPMARVPRSIWVILHDPEPETCWVLAVWAGFILGYREFLVLRERRLLEVDLLRLAEGEVVFPDHVRDVARQLEQLPVPVQTRLLPRTLRMCMTRFAATRSVQHAAEAARDECELEASRLDAELSMIRFAVWAIPAVGFVGTVRGIGAALQEAQRAAAGDVTGVTQGLGITFNATLVALTLAITVMFFLHQLQLSQDRLVLDAKSYIDTHLIGRLRER
ncbi:MAG: MotA/TolQ/ExbB proton channel family protein [Gammaproteobacteria bacterium]